MTAPPDVVVLADHSVLLAIPAFAPAILVVGVVVYIAMRDRRRKSSSEDETAGSSGQDGTP
jgi:hypothetical protein